MLKLDLSRDALGCIQTWEPKQYRYVVGTIFRLLQNPEPQDASALTGYPYRRVDIGEYRMIDNVDGDGLKVVLISKRNDDAIYRTLRRRRWADHECSSSYRAPTTALPL